MGDKNEFLKMAFVVDDLPENFDPSADPSDGLEYLQQVRWEASKCDDVVTAVIDKAKLKNRAVVNILPECKKVPRQFLPDLEWQQQQIAKFSALRQKMSKYRKRKPPQESAVKVPQIGDEKAWYDVCVEYKTPPLVSVVLPLPQRLVEWLLQCNVEWLSDSERLTQYQGRWIYALMACLELPLTPESCSSLRTLARECARIRAYEVSNAEEPVVIPLNLLICLVANYFRQMDLADIDLM
ncbi:gem-associated protein 2 isoform X2 [Schistocerca cancellata]|uniref:gem-associated protein 2 isoform X2 n=1 Tax=Schistocerca cancellata TaxID=274614 RepID=UPI0021187155|nr:gem-associated protein 2 isoform X2 [Schistocerca cancellata]